MIIYRYHFAKRIVPIMMKIYIELDNEKIAREKKYDVESLYQRIDSLFQQREMYKDESGWYTNGDFVKCGSFILSLKDSSWFTDNIKECFWYDSFDSSIEDVKYYYNPERKKLFG